MRDADKRGQKVAVVEPVLNQEPGLGAGKGEAFDHPPDDRAPAGRWLDEQPVVADQRDDRALAIDRRLAKHLAVGDVSGATQLVADVFDELEIGGHAGFESACRLETLMEGHGSATYVSVEGERIHASESRFHRCACRVRRHHGKRRRVDADLQRGKRRFRYLDDGVHVRAGLGSDDNFGEQRIATL